ncbi:MAG TPA: contractile injection system protein, VgrG/Pvc8 family, partial [Roseateles sp.]|nr:contractile injection system protein, VgrG/Pvc8 family [Roseateles sp.]
MAQDVYRIDTESPAGKDLMFWTLVGQEAMSQPSVYELRVLSKNDAIAAKDILGHAFDVVFRFHDVSDAPHERHCRGHAVRFARRGARGRYFEYVIELRSWFWLLEKHQNARIFQGQDVLEVMDAVVHDSPIRKLWNVNK